MTERVVSSRAEQIAAATPFRLLWSYVEAIDYFRRRENPNVCDFTFGDPHQMASPAYVSAIQQAVVPLNESLFAYKWYGATRPAGRGRIAVAANRAIVCSLKTSYSPLEDSLHSRSA